MRDRILPCVRHRRTHYPTGTGGRHGRSGPHTDSACRPHRLSPTNPVPTPSRESTRPLGELRGDVAVSGFWERGQQTIFDVTVSHVDAPSYGGRPAEKVLAERARAKRLKYESLCKETRRAFTPLTFGVDGTLGTSTVAALRRLASALAHRGGRTYSEMCGFVRSRLSLTLVRAAHTCLRGARDSYAKPKRPFFGSSAGYSLYR